MQQSPMTGSTFNKEKMYYFDCDTFDQRLKTLTQTKNEKDKFTLLVEMKKLEKDIKIRQQQIQVT